VCSVVVQRRIVAAMGAEQSAGSVQFRKSFVRIPVGSERHCDYCSGTGKHFHTAHRPMDVGICSRCLGSGCCMLTPRFQPVTEDTALASLDAHALVASRMALQTPHNVERLVEATEQDADCQGKVERTDLAVLHGPLAKERPSARTVGEIAPDEHADPENASTLRETKSEVDSELGEENGERIQSTETAHRREFWQGRAAKLQPVATEDGAWSCDVRGFVKPVEEKEAPDAEFRRALFKARMSFEGAAAA